MQSNNHDMPGRVDMQLVTETLGREPGSTVVSIGATLFDPFGRVPLHEDPRNHLYLVINSFDSQNMGLASSPEMMKWWARKEIWPALSQAVYDSSLGVKEACQMLQSFMDEKQPQKIWSNSPMFHQALLHSIFQKAGMQLTINYRQPMDYRSIMEMTYPNRANRPDRPSELQGFKPYDALGDAINQAHQTIVAHAALALLPAGEALEPLSDDAAREALDGLTQDQKDAMLMHVLTGNTERLTRERILADSHAPRHRMSPR